MTDVWVLLWAIVILLTVYCAAQMIELRYASRLNRWENERTQMIVPVFHSAFALAWVPDHASEFTVDGPGGNVVHSGTMLNYDTLKSMLRAMTEQEDLRRSEALKLRESLKDVERWEKDHPQPKPFTVFGHRIPLPL